MIGGYRIIFRSLGIFLVALMLIITLGVSPSSVYAVSIPTVETRPASSISQTAAFLNGRVVNDGGSTILERRFDWGTTSSCADGWTASVGVSGDYFAFYLTGLNPGTTYYFRAWAKNSAGWGHGSVLSFTTSQAADTTKPTVNSLSVSPSSVILGSSFSIYYSVSDTGGSGLNRVELWRANDSGGSPTGWSEVKRTSASGNSYSGSFSDAPSSGGTYWYGIHAVDNASNWAAESSPVKVTVTAPTQAPVHVSPSNGATSVSLTPTFQWQAVSGATKYGFYVSKPPYGEANLIYENESVTGTSLTLPSGILSEGITYRWNMRAGNAAGWGPFSSSWSFTTNPPALPDLIIYDITVSPNPPTSGGSTTIGITIKNQGTGNAVGTFYLEYYFDSTYIGRVSWNGLAAGATQTTYWNAQTWPSDTNAHTLKGLVDPYNTVSESNEGNNQLSKQFTARINQSPTCSVTANPRSGQAPLTVTFTISASDSDGSISAWVLDVDGDGNADYYGTGSPPSTKTHTYTSPSSTSGYSVVLMVSDNNGATAFDTETVVVGANSPPTCSLSASPSSGPAPLTVTFTMSASDSDGSISTWALDVNFDGVVEHSGSGYPPSTKSYTYQHGGSYTAILMVSDDKDTTASAIKIVDVTASNQPPVAYIDSITPNPATQGTHTVSFTGHGSDPDGSVFAYNWRSSRDGQLSTSSSFNKPASELSVGTHTIYFKVMDDDGDWSTEDTETLTINPAPQPEQITITLYVHENTTDGPIIAGARVTGRDGAGNSYDQTTNSNGYAIITGVPGTWSFTASKTGYDTKSWSQVTTTTQTAHAYLTKQGTGDTAPDPPSNLSATAGTNDIQLNWDPPASDGGSPVTGYCIYRGTSPGAESYYASISGTSFRNTAITAGITYYYYVTAVNVVGESSASNRVSAVAEAPSLAQFIEELTIDSVAVTVAGQSYFILTLEHSIDPTTLQVVADSGQTKLYTDVNGDPVSDGNIAQKIGIIEIARGIGDPQLSQRITVLGETRELISQTSGKGWVNIVSSGVVDHIKWQKVYNFNDFMQYWDPARTTWHNLKAATIKSPPSGLLVKAATALLQKILGDPFGEVKNDLQNSLSSAISYYDSIEGIDSSEIMDYDEACRFLSNLYYGKSKEEIASYLNDKLSNNIINLLDDVGPVASILTLTTKVPLIGQALALLEFPKLAWEAKLATDWTVETLYRDTLKQYENRADLLYKLTDGAKYSLELAQAHEDVTSYKMKYLKEIATGYTEAAKIPEAVFDYLANFDWDTFISSLKQIILGSPGELRVYDSQERVTGLVNGEIKEEIPDSVYADGTVLIFSSTGSYRYEVVGTDQGTYGLEMGFREGEEVECLALTNVPIVLGEVHKYTIEGGALSSGQATINVGIDLDSDGIFDAEETLRPPIASFHFSPSEVHVNQRIEFDASQSYDVDGEIVLYQWNFGGGDISTGKTTMHAYSIAGEYVMMLVVVDNDGVASSRLSIIQVEETPSSGCFIASAAYGTPMAEGIQILREFRDDYLLTNALGQAFVGFYYEVSPPIAEFITEHPSLKPIVRTGLLPAVAMSAIAINTTPIEKAAIVGSLALVSVALAIWVTRRRGKGIEHT